MAKMDMKAFWKSKTVWGLAILAASQYFGFGGFVDEVALLGMILTALGIRGTGDLKLM